MKPLADKRIAMVVHDNYENVELSEPRDALIAMGADVDVLTTSESRQLQGMDHITPSDTLEADAELKSASAEDYDAVIIPGGVVNSDILRIQSSAQEFVGRMFEAGKPVAAICHAPWLLISAGIAEDKTMTAYPTLKDDIQNAGATWADKEVVIDQNIITSRNPDDIPAFTQAIVNSLGPIAPAP